MYIVIITEANQTEPAKATSVPDTGSVRYHPPGSARVRTGTGSGSFIAAQSERNEAWPENQQPTKPTHVNIPPMRDATGHRRSPSSISDGM